MYDDSICILCFTVLLRLSLATRLWPPAFPPNQPSPQPLPGSSRSLILPSNLRSRISQTCEIPANGSNPRRWGDTTFGTWRLYRGMSAWRRVPARRIRQPRMRLPIQSTDAITMIVMGHQKAIATLPQRVTKPKKPKRKKGTITYVTHDA